ncbi:MAG: hypothetical protein IIW67_03090, partial [Peptococcaceae bacterium]|nr:hypothetical protein [Peptococcaceae bacterium]
MYGGPAAEDVYGGGMPLDYYASGNYGNSGDFYGDGGYSTDRNGAMQSGYDAAGNGGETHGGSVG